MCGPLLHRDLPMAQADLLPVLLLSFRRGSNPHPNPLPWSGRGERNFLLGKDYRWKTPVDGLL
jgi:hypothetical protein